MDDNSSTKDLISTKEAAEILEVTPRAIGYWRERKISGIPLFTADEKHGDTWYYYRERIEQLKSVYRKGILMDLYRIAAIEDMRNERLNENTPAPDFQKPGITCCNGEGVSSSSDLFTSEQASQYLGVDKGTLSRWNANEKFQPLIIDHKGDFRYSREQLTKMKTFCTGGKSSGNELPVGQSFSDFFKAPENRVIKKFNVQIYPSKILCFPNDIFSKRLFNLSNEDYQQALDERKILEVVEKKNHRKFGDVITPFRIGVNNNADFTLSEPLDQFDFAVLCACISEWRKENRYTTPAIIYRAISGKVEDRDADPSKNQLEDILQSVDKLMRTQIGINMTKACEDLKYNGGTAFKTVSTILPCQRVTDTTINGQTATIISFDRESPLWQIAANVKNHQVLSCDTEVLNVPKQQNTRMNVSVKFYILRRVLEILAHRRQMTPIITFDDIFKKCRITNMHREIKKRARETCIDFFKHLQRKNFIKAFQLNKKDVLTYSISFTR